MSTYWPRFWPTLYVHAEAQTLRGRFVVDVIMQARLQQMKWQIEPMELEPYGITGVYCPRCKPLEVRTIDEIVVCT